MMEHKTWLWKKKSTDKVNPLLKEHEQEIQVLKAEKVELENEVKNLTDKLSAALSDCDNKEEQVKKTTAGWEDAKSENVSLRQELDRALEQRLVGEERISQLDDALKECMQQLDFVRSEQEKRIRDAVMKASKEFEKSKMVFDEKLSETSKRLAKVVSENTNLSKVLLSKEKSIDDLSKQKGNSEADLAKIMSQLYSLEKDNNSLKYEVRVLEKEVQIRNEDREFNRRTADASHKQYLDSTKKIAKLESECQRLRVLVRKRLPGPAALAKMKNEVEWLGRESVNIRRKSLQESESVNLLTEQLCGLQEENKNLKDALVKKIHELQFSRTMYARAASKLESRVEEISESPSCKSARGSEISLMDDFVEMEKLAVFSFESPYTRSDDIVTASVSEPIESESTRISSQEKLLESEKLPEVTNFEQAADNSQCDNDLFQKEDIEQLTDNPIQSGDLSNQLEDSEKKVTIPPNAERENSSIAPKEEEKQLRTEVEITASSVKLAECQETILNLGKQMKALASSPSDTNSVSPKKKLTHERSTLLDCLLAEDDNVTDNAITGPTLILDGAIQPVEKIVFVNVSADSLAMVPRNRAKNVGLWRKLVST